MHILVRCRVWVFFQEGSFVEEEGNYECFVEWDVFFGCYVASAFWFSCLEKSICHVFSRNLACVEKYDFSLYFQFFYVFSGYSQISYFSLVVSSFHYSKGGCQCFCFVDAFIFWQSFDEGRKITRSTIHHGPHLSLVTPAFLNDNLTPQLQNQNTISRIWFFSFSFQTTIITIFGAQ